MQTELRGPAAGTLYVSILGNYFMKNDVLSCYLYHAAEDECLENRCFVRTISSIEVQ